MVQIYEAEVVFDSPKYFEDGRYGPFYSMALALPPGSPGTEYIEKYDRHQVYLGFNPGSEEEPYLKSLSSGDKIQVVWDDRGRGKYKPILPKSWDSSIANDSEPKVTKLSETKTVGTASQDQDSGSGLLTEREKSAFRLAIDEVIPILAYARSRLPFTDMDEGTLQKYAVTAFLYAKDRYRRINPDAIEEEHEDDTNRIRTIIFGLDPETLPKSLLVTISQQSEYIENAKEVADILNKFGITSDDVDPEDKETWWQCYIVAHSYGMLREDIGEKEAGIAVANQYGLVIPD